MPIKIVDTTGWLPHQLDLYWPQIFAAMVKLKTKLPDDISYSVILSVWHSGRRKLWLVLDDNDAFMAFAMTEIETNLATGKRFVTLKDMAGDGVIAARAEICAALEKYADSEGIGDRRIHGLLPWARVTAPFGYEPHTITLRKLVNADG
jgi:hypothetical protein